MKDLKLIRGAGGGGKGGGGGSRPAEEDPNTLFSAAKARIVDLVSEGEIVGLVNGDKSIFINETPLENDAGDKNFEDVSYSTRVGTNSQSYIAGFAGVETEVPVNIEVKIDAPGDHIETIITSQLDAVRVLVYTPALTKQDKDDGDMHGSSFSFKFYIEKNNDGTWSEVLNKTIEGKCTSRYERSYRIDIPSSWKTSGFTQIAVKMERITDDAPDTSTNNKSFWGSYTQIIDNKLRYPNSALIATQIDARQFTSIPKRGYEIKGLKVKIPSNYTAYDIGYCSNKSGYRRQDRCIQDAGTCSGGNATGSEDYAACIALGGEASWSSSNTWTGTSVGTNLYNGSWDGTFVIGWTCNPAWIFYDLCTDDRYGLGKWLTDSQLDKWSLYEIAKYCDAVDNSGNFIGVDDGWGNKEARFSCNLYLQSSEEAYKVLNDVASVFRGMMYWQQGQITAVQDSPKDPVMTFSDANVINGAFTYEGSSRKQRHNVAHVTWNNPEDFYRQNVEYVEDAAGIISANNQIISTDVTAVGCISQSQARRVGKWLLYTEKYETEIVTFTTGLDGALVRPGDIVKIADSHRAGIRYGGRVSAGSTTTTINLDNATSVTSGNSYTLSLINTEEACVQSGVKQALPASCSDASLGTETACIQDAGTCSGGAATGSEDYAACIALGGEASWSSSNTWTSQQALCLNAHVDNEWKPYVWLETKDVSTVTTTENVTSLTVTSAFSNTPTVEYMWILEESGSVEAQDFRILSVRESGESKVEISALKYHEAKFNYIENDIAFSSKSTSNLPNLNDTIPTPANLTIEEELYKDSDNRIRNRGFLSWCPAGLSDSTCTTGNLYKYTHSYYVEYRRKTPTISNWISLGETTSTGANIDDAPVGTYEFRVKTNSIYNKSSSFASSGDVALLGKTAAPGSVATATFTATTIP